MRPPLWGGLGKRLHDVGCLLPIPNTRDVKRYQVTSESSKIRRLRRLPQIQPEKSSICENLRHLRMRSGFLQLAYRLTNP